MIHKDSASPAITGIAGAVPVSIHQMDPAMPSAQGL